MTDNTQAVTLAPDNVHAAQSPSALIALAIKTGADVEKLERLFDLETRWREREARAAYYRAKSAFQAACPPIQKSQTANAGKFSYKYASLSDVVKSIRDTLAEHGLSYRWEVIDTPERIEVKCIVSHVDGHSEATSLGAVPDDSGAKNQIQQRGSTLTYLQRYTLIGALGLSSADEDDDGRSSGALNIEWLILHNAIARDWLGAILAIKDNLTGGDISIAAEAYSEMPRMVIQALFIAPSKGGLFTTEERARCKDDKAFQDEVHRRRTDSGWYDRPENQI